MYLPQILQLVCVCMACMGGVMCIVYDEVYINVCVCMSVLLMWLTSLHIYSCRCVIDH